MRKSALLILAALLIVLQAGCAAKQDDRINVISREAGSGTRDAFTELMGIKKDGKDNTVITSEITSSTFVVIKSVSVDKNAIGYVSLGTLSDNVKALSIDGIKPTAENIKNQTYPLIRTFNIIDTGALSKQAEDFVQYIISSQGAEIIEEQGYVPFAQGPEYHIKEGMEGRIVIAGSTSVAPLIDVIADEYKKIYPDVEIEIQQTGSGAGITSTIEGACDLGISSRELKEEERLKGARKTTVALDGIVVIVNLQNPTDSLSTEEVRQIFTGERKAWKS